MSTGRRQIPARLVVAERVVEVTPPAPRPLPFALEADDPRPLPDLERSLDVDPVWTMLSTCTTHPAYVATLRLYRRRWYAAARLRQLVTHLDLVSALATERADQAGLPAAPSPVPIASPHIPAQASSRRT